MNTDELLSAMHLSREWLEHFEHAFGDYGECSVKAIETTGPASGKDDLRDDTPMLVFSVEGYVDRVSLGDLLVEIGPLAHVDTIPLQTMGDAYRCELMGTRGGPIDSFLANASNRSERYWHDAMNCFIRYEDPDKARRGIETIGWALVEIDETIDALVSFKCADTRADAIELVRRYLHVQSANDDEGAEQLEHSLHEQGRGFALNLLENIPSCLLALNSFLGVFGMRITAYE